MPAKEFSIENSRSEGVLLMARKLLFNVTLAFMSLTAAARCQEVGPTPRQICTFTANASYYANIATPPGKLEIQWNKSTGAMTSFYWDDKFDDKNTIWVESPAPPSSVKQYEGIYYYAVNIWINATPPNPNPDRITGYIAPAKNLTTPGNNLTFAAIVEGTGTAWIAAQGTLTNDCSLVP
jgi:hypothetical protein